MPNLLNTNLINENCYLRHLRQPESLPNPPEERLKQFSFITEEDRDSPDRLKEDLEAENGPKADPALIETISRNVGPAADWLFNDLKVEFTKRPSRISVKQIRDETAHSSNASIKTLCSFCSSSKNSAVWF